MGDCLSGKIFTKLKSGKKDILGITKKEKLLEKKINNLTERLKKSEKKFKEQTSQKRKKKVEEELKLHSKILKNMSEGVILIRMKDAKIVYANPKFDKIFGYAKDELFGKHVSVVIAPRKDISPRETARKIIARLKKRGGWHGEVYNRKKDGTPFWCYASVSTFNHPRFGPVWVGVYTNITEKKKAEEELKNSETKYHTMFDQSVNSIVIVDPETGKLVEFNDRVYKQLGYTLKEFEKLKLSDFEAVEAPEKCMNHIKKVLIKGFDRFETKHRTKKGEIRDVIVKCKVIALDGKKFIQSTWIDITELKQKNKELRQKTEEIEKFNRLAVQREIKIIKMKMKTKALEQKTKELDKKLKKYFDKIIKL